MGILSLLNRCDKMAAGQRGRPRGRGRKVDPALPPDAHAALVLLAKRKRYGITVNEVARYLILRGIDDMTRAGELPPEPISYADLAERLTALGVKETERNVSNKIARGGFLRPSFSMQCMEAIGVGAVHLNGD